MIHTRKSYSSQYASIIIACRGNCGTQNRGTQHYIVALPFTSPMPKSYASMLSNNSLYAWSASITSGEMSPLVQEFPSFCSVTDVDVVCVLRMVDAVHAVSKSVPIQLRFYTFS